MSTLYRERHVCDEVVFDWKAASVKLPQDELITSLENDMFKAIKQLEKLTNHDEREVGLKRIEFLRVSIVRARLGREMITLTFRMPR